jgi:hypothetical protein
MVISLVTNNGDEIKLGYNGVYMMSESYDGQTVKLIQVGYVDGTYEYYNSWESYKTRNL